MASSETLFNPHTDSLADKVKAYTELCRDFARIRSSLKSIRKYGNADYLGDTAQVESAYTLIESSLSEASRVVSDAEILRAKEQRLITGIQFADIVKINRKWQADKSRQQQRKSKASDTLYKSY